MRFAFDHDGTPDSGDSDDSEHLRFGGLEDVRFRDSVLPGDRLIVMCRLSKVRRGRMIICDFQGVVKDRIVVEGVLKGVPIPVEAVREFMAKRQA